jgi:hypothetical protein
MEFSVTFRDDHAPVEYSGEFTYFEIQPDAVLMISQDGKRTRYAPGAWKSIGEPQPERRNEGPQDDQHETMFEKESKISPH